MFETKEALYKVEEVAAYLLNESLARNSFMTAAKLYNMLYFAQAAFLVHYDGVPCFEDDIVAWACGASVPALHHDYGLASMTIFFPTTTLLAVPENGFGLVEVPYSDDFIRNKEDRKLLDAVVGYGMHFSPMAMTERVTSQYPWKYGDLYGDRRYKSGRKCFNDVIPKEKIWEYFYDYKNKKG